MLARREWPNKGDPLESNFEEMQIDLAAEIPIQFYPPTKNKNMSSCDYFYDFEVLNIYSNDFAINIKLYELIKNLSYIFT